MRITILIDNLSRDELVCEWGLAIYIEDHGRKILLDSGTSGSFADNAEKLGVNLAEVEMGALSHAHYDHANGFDRFFAVNDRGKIYISSEVKENLYGWKKLLPYYGGIRRGMLKEHAGRFVRVQGRMEALPGVWLLGHDAPYFPEMGKRGKLYVRRGLWLRPDDFRHEQSLIFEEESTLVVFNSCSHSGPDVVIREAEAAFPGKRVRAIIGGFHLFRCSEAEVRALADRLRKCGVEKIVTGHCTGDAAYAILSEELGDRVCQMYSGMCVEI